MHCWKVIHVEREYGVARIALLSLLVFVLTFCFSYTLLSFHYPVPHKDDYFWVNIIIVPLLYPLHKYVHYVALLGYKKSISKKLVLRYRYIPLIRMRLNDLIPRRRYMLALVAPFLLLNSIIVSCSLQWPQFGHYFSFYFAYHCSICVLDFLYVKHLYFAPKNAIIEETPKGYEILVPPAN